MTKRAETLNFGPRRLSRRECFTCGEVTLHDYNVCIHCKTPPKTYVAPELRRWNGGAVKVPRSQR